MQNENREHACISLSLSLSLSLDLALALDLALSLARSLSRSLYLSGLKVLAGEAILYSVLILNRARF